MHRDGVFSRRSGRRLQAGRFRRPVTPERTRPTTSRRHRATSWPRLARCRRRVRCVLPHARTVFLRTRRWGLQRRTIRQQ
jgi:hypothetical protein